MPKDMEGEERPRITAARSTKLNPRPKGHRSEEMRAYYLANQEVRRARAKENWHGKDPYEKAVSKFRGYAQPRLPREGSKRSLQPRYVSLALAYCEWSDIEEVVRIYLACGIMNELGWDDYHVDHVVPLNSNLVCGLHVHHNLRVVSHRENALKGNMLWPGMPDVNWGTLDFLLSGP